MALAPAHLDPVRLNPNHPWSKLAIHNVSATWFTVAALFSYFILALSILKDSPIWIAFVWAMIPWVLLFIAAPLIQMKPEDRANFRADKWFSRLALHRVPTTYILASSLVSAVVLALALLQGLPNWLSFGLALAPWTVVIFLELEWMFAHFGWFALFTTMAIVQTIHYSEHCIEVIQYHVFHQPLAQSLAIFTNLNPETVHFTGDTFLTLGTILLIWRFPRNPFLWIAIPFQLAHQAEHNYLFFNYLFNGAKPGGAGLLGKGGAIHGGIGLVRTDLHWLYNTLYTIPFVTALIYQAKHIYDASLKKALPHLTTAQLIGLTKKMETFHYAAGETVLAPGDPSDRLYIISEGSATVYRHDDTGREVEVATLHAGQYFGEIGLLVPGAPHTKTVRASTRLTVLAMNKETFQSIVQTSHETGEDMSKIAQDHMARVAAAAEASATAVPSSTAE